MGITEINVLSWEDAQKKLPSVRDLQNKGLLEVISRISQFLKKDNRNYVYHLRLKFGDKIIDKGKTIINVDNHYDFDRHYQIIGNEFKKTKSDFVDDVLYTDDPLGLVLSNYIEVYAVNRYVGSSEDKYTVLLNNIDAGGFFGLFGMLDYISKTLPNKENRVWYARAGTVSFSIAFPFHLDLYKELDCESRFTHLSGKQNKPEITPGDNKIEFIRRYLDNWFVDIAYIPRHFFEVIPDQLKNELCTYLFKIGWDQSSYLRNTLLEDTTIYDQIVSSENIKHDKGFIYHLYKYLYEAHHGQSIVLKPLLDKDHVVWLALEEFKKKNPGYFNCDKFIEPLPFYYDTLKDRSEIGLVSVFQLPILKKYNIISLHQILADLHLIHTKIEINPQIDKVHMIPKISGYGRPGGSGNVKQIDFSFLRPLIADSFKISCERVLKYGARDFQNLLLIKLDN